MSIIQIIKEQMNMTERERDICRYILENPEKIEEMSSRWDDIDNGSVDYEQNIDNIAASLPDRLESAVRTLFREWPRHLTPINDTLRFIDELKERNIPLYLLSNAPTYFAEYAVNYDFLKEFSGILFSAPLKMAKPDPAIYRYLFETKKQNRRRYS